MKEKIVPSKPAGSGGYVFDGVPALPENKNANVSSGPYSEELPVAGMTVGEIRRRFSDRFDIDSQSQAIINGAPVGEDAIIKATESLMFIRHAGEKGVTQVYMEGTDATVERDHGSAGTMTIADLCQRVGPAMSTGEVVLPTGIKSVLSQGNITLWVWEQPPRVHKFRWISETSPKPYGPEAEYRDVTIALPYLVIVSPFLRGYKGIPDLIRKDECFFRNAPLKGLDDELCYPGLLNCSNYGSTHTSHPLSWICTQYLKQTRKMHSKDPGDRFQAGFEAVRYCLLETAFNLSSEHHEGNSWYGESKKIIPNIATVSQWEKETKKDPLFVLDLPWIPTRFSVRKLAERMFAQYNYGDLSVKTADDLARIIINR